VQYDALDHGPVTVRFTGGRVKTRPALFSAVDASRAVAENTCGKRMKPLAVITLSFALSVALALPSIAQATRPTPHELIDQAMRPVTDQLTQLNASEAERRDVADIVTRGETIASELVEAQHRNETDRVRSLAHHLELLGRVVRGRVEAGRAELQASEAERIALEAETRRVQARAALERAAERRLELEREPASTPSTAPAAVPNGSAATEPAATPAPAAHPAPPVHAATTRRGHR
jgi:hypothetical protein